MGKRRQSIRQEQVARRKRARKKKHRKMAFILGAEILVLCILLIVGYGVIKLNKLDFNPLNQDDIEVYRDSGPYTNIALFGLDSREGELDGGVQSDCIMIASINNKTDDVKLLSIYRDDLMQQKDETYEKANSAYNTGGPAAAISMLNRNLDLNIQNYVSVNFNALVDVIDLLGGLDIELTAEEAFYCNGYAFETAQITGKEMVQIDEVAGMHHLDGVHAVGYARIRYTEGDDFKRSERQRYVLNLVAEKAKQADISTLNAIIDQVFPQISTSFTSSELLGFAVNGLNYNIVESAGFPFDVTVSDKVRNHSGSYVIPVDHANNVVQLHKFLFDEEYEVSEKIESISDDIAYLSGVSNDSAAMEMTFEDRMAGETENE